MIISPGGYASLWDKCVLYGALLGMASVCIYFDWPGRVDHLLYDWSLRFRPPPPSADIVIVAIDEKSLSALGRWPWPRRYHARLTEKLTEAQAKAIAFDVVFAEPQIGGPQDDQSLAAALKDNGTVVLPVVPEQPHQGAPLKEVLPLPDLVRAAAALGHTDIALDADGIARSTFMRAGSGSPYWLHCALAMLQVAAPQSEITIPGVRNGDASLLGDGAWIRDHRVWVPFAGPPGTFNAVSYVEVLRGSVPPRMFRNKFVLVGPTANGLGIQVSTPVSGRGQPMSGVEFNANVLNGLYQGITIRPLRNSHRMVLTAIVLLFPLLLYGYVSPRWAPFVPVVLVALSVATAVIVLGSAYMWIAPMPALLALVLSYPLWSWRQLQLTVTYVRQELNQFRTDLTDLNRGEPPRLAAVMDFITVIIPINGLWLGSATGQLQMTWGRPPTQPSWTHLPQGTWTRADDGYWLLQEWSNGVWALGIHWDGSRAPGAAELDLLRQVGQCLLPGDSAEMSPGMVDLVRAQLLQITQATARLREVRRFIGESLGQLPEGVVVADCLGRVRFANSRTATYLHLENQQPLEGATLFDLLAHLESEEGVDWHEAVRSALLYRQAIEVTARNALDRDLLINIAPFSQAQQDSYGVVISLVDVSTLKRQQTRLLREERTRAQVTLDSIGDGVVTTDARGLVQYMNPVAEKLTGYRSSEACGRALGSILAVIDEQNGERIRLSEADCLSTVKITHALKQGLLVSRGGERFAVRASAAPIINQAGERSGLVLALSDITDTRRLSQQMAFQATHDALTQLPNRLLLSDRLEHAIANAARFNLIIGVLFIDLDRFKSVNDGLGHAVGDALLREVGNRLNANVRRGDTVARIGGDEFVVVLENLSEREGVTIVGEKVLHALNEPFWIAGHELLVTGSIGMSLFPQDGESPETLLRNADMAMYRSKDEGRNRLHFYSKDMNLRALKRLRLERDLRRGLDRGDFELYYQPQVCLESGEVLGFEALLRWQHPSRGMVGPAEFLDVAEETGLIKDIGDWVLTTACRQCRAWQQRYARGLKVSVNLSTRQFTRKGLIEQTALILHASGLEPASLDIEITEGMIMQDVETAIAHFRAFKQMGVSLSIDDFGTGYSSLNYLKRFPIDRLKIDKSFIRDVSTDTEDAAIALAIISMAHSMNLRVIAEGVEHTEQLDFLRSRGCDEIQGYLFSPPLSVREVDVLLATHRTLDI